MVIPVTAAVDDDGMVHIQGDNVSLVRWNHRPTLVRDALHRFSGMADWKPRWHILAVPAESFFGGARTVFNLAAPDERRQCYVHRTTNLDHLVPSAPSPTNLPPVQIAAREAAAPGRPVRLTRFPIREQVREIEAGPPHQPAPGKSVAGWRLGISGLVQCPTTGFAP